MDNKKLIEARQMTKNKQFKYKYANSGATYCTITLILNYKQMLHSHQKLSHHFTSLPFTPLFSISSPTQIPFTYIYFSNPLSETLLFPRENR